MKCAECGAKYKWHGFTMSTEVFFQSPDRHDHDDNCVTRRVVCENGHGTTLSRVNRCSNPDCDWIGKNECFCHKGTKVWEFPEGTEADVHLVEGMPDHFEKDGSLNQEKFAKIVADRQAERNA